jgi:DNA gyrase inhibitor GyrI
MRVAAALGFGTRPEEMAWRQLWQWASAKGLLADLKAQRFYGFNNPCPSPGSPNYGYEQWMTVGPQAQQGDDVETKGFAGGLYAVARCQLKNITQVWGQLSAWCESSRYAPADHQWLEECLTPERFMPEMAGDAMEAVFELYLPIAE